MANITIGPEIRVGLIGVGPVAELIARSYDGVAGAKVVAVADENFARAEELGKRLGVAAFADPRELLEKGGVDAVEIHGRADRHLAVARDACAKGKPFAVHKPLALTLADANAIVDAARSAGVPAAVIDPLLHHPHVIAAKEKLDEQLVGEIQMLRLKSHLGGAGELGAGFDPARFSADDAHFLLAPAFDKAALIEYLLGPIAEVSGYAGPGARMIAFKFTAPGRYGVHEAVFSPTLPMQTDGMPVDNSVEITGTDGILWARNLTATMVEAPKLMLKRKSVVTVWDDKAEYCFGNLLSAVRTNFVNFLRGRESPRHSLADGVRALTVNLATQTAIGESRPVKLADFRG